MRRFWCLIFLGSALGWIAGAAEKNAVPPPAVDKALRERIEKFFQAHVDGKFRVADQYVAEDSKDYFFESDKPRYLSFAIASITYSDRFTKATALVNCEAEMSIPLVGGKVKTKIPRTTLWKLENKQWFWYVLPNTGVETPFGIMTAGPEAAAAPKPTADKLPKGPEVKDLWNMVRADRAEVTLSAEQPSAEVAVTNGMPGAVVLAVAAPPQSGLEVKLDRSQLVQNETARLTVRADFKEQKPHTPTVVRVGVEPTGQVINIRVLFAAPAEAK